jgi:restriction system protein
MAKVDQLRQLVQRRRMPEEGTTAVGYSRNYKKLGDFHDGAYDEDDYVVPWAKSAFNLDAEIMLVAQDWASEDFLSGDLDLEQQRLGHAAHLPSNRNLFQLLGRQLDLTFADTYATDTFVFVKPGSMTTRIVGRDLALSATNYTLPQIRIIRPKIVVCVGSAAYNALRRTLGLGYATIRDAFDQPPFVYEDTTVVGVTHTGGSSTAFAGGFDVLQAQWARVQRLRRAL